MKNPRYVDSDHTGIVLDRDEDGNHCIFVEATGSGADIYRRALAGEFGEIAPYTPPPSPSEEELADAARVERDGLLAASDWTQVADAPVDKEAWAEYRQALRDVPQQSEFPVSINWPEPPAAQA